MSSHCMDDAEAYFQQSSRDFNNSAIFCPSRDFDTSAIFAPALPPPGAESQLKSIDIGELTVFYHPTWLVAQKGHYFTWNYYIGRAGQGTESIIDDRSKQGIVVKEEGLSGDWEECLALVTGARRHVRLSYLDAGGMRTHELILPPDPTDLASSFPSVITVVRASAL